MSKDNTITTIGILDSATNRMGITLLALNWLQSEDSLQYFKDLDKDDIPHNLDALFEEIRTIHSMLHEEVDQLSEYKEELKGSVNVQ